MFVTLPTQRMLGAFGSEPFVIDRL